jgi:phage major head subunit gpT-like protein
MAIVTSDFLAGVMTNFKATFADSFDAARNLAAWRAVAMEVPSTSATTTHTWLGTVPRMVDTTKGDTQMDPMYPFSYSITNNTYRGTVEVERAAFEDDELGLISRRIQQLGEEADRHPGELVLKLPVTNGLAFDGVAYFATSGRAIGAGASVVNSLTQTGLTIANIQTDLGLVRKALRLFQDDQGRPMNNVLNAVMVEPGIEQPMYQALGITFPANAPTAAPIPPGGATITTVNGYTIIVNPYITDANEWYGFSLTPSMRPFIYQTRVAPALEALINAPPSVNAVMSDRFIYSVRARYNVGYGDPRYAVRVT